MAKKKVHELAKELDIQSKDIVGFLKERGSEIKNHMSVIDEGQIDLVQKHFNKGNTLKEKNMKRETGANSNTQVPQLNSNDTNVPQLNSNGTNVPQLNSNGTNVPQLKKKVTEVKQQGNIEKAVHEGEKMSQNPVRTQNEQMTEKPSVERRAAGNQQASGEHRVQSDRVQGDRPVGQYGDRRPQGDRPQGQHGDRRPQGDRPQGQYGDRRPQGDRPQGQYGDRRPQGDRPQGQYGDRRPQGDRPQGQYGDRRPQGDRPAGQYGDRRPQGDRPAGGQYGDRRPQGDRPAGGQYGDRRPQGDRPQGQYGDRRPQGDRPQGQYGNRPQGDRPSGQYGNRPQGDRPSGQYGNRPQGDRPSGQYGNRPQGDRPSGQYGNRPQGGNFGSRTSGGNRQGGTGFGGGGFDKDKDFGNNNRSFDKRKNDPKSSEKSSLKTDLANELTKEQRAAAFNDRNRDKNRSKQRDDIDDGNIKLGKGKKDPNRKGAFIMPKPQLINAQPEEEISIILIPEIITIKELADKMKKPASVVVKKLFLEGKMVSINQEISFEEAEEIALGYDIMAEKEVPVDIVEELLREEEEDVSLMQKRPPVVCVMGHVDHGKTSLLDSIREANVTSREAGGITQHIGAYVVEAEGEKITFLDTPGHEAFTSMRMRGAKSTDIAILVVAADDGVMPQTVEAISHAKAAGVQIIVAVNKIDKPSANVEKVKQELTEYGLVAEEWGGDTVFVPVSAHTKEGINQLLEMILITADMCELKANPNRKARGIVIEAQLDKGKGTVATVLVQKGTLCVGDNIAVGSAYGKVRAMMDDKGNRVKEAGISTPVEILGLNEVPNAGEVFISTENDKEARNIAEAFIKQDREKLLADTKAKLSLDGLFTQIKAGNIKELNIIIKADVQGSVEAMKQSLLKLSNEEVAIRVIHGGVGTVNESDVTLAATSSAIIIGFNVRTDNTARETAEREKVDLRLYRVIYNAIEDVEAAMKGMLDPVYEEKVIAHAEVRQIFKASDIGLIAGSYVLDGKIVRGCQARITREGTKIYEGNLASLKRFKDDVKEVAAGYECGLVFEKFQDIKEFDIVELYTMVEVPR